MFDFAPLTSYHPHIFLLAFFLTYLLIGLLTRASDLLIIARQTPRIYYAGAVLAAVTTLLAIQNIVSLKQGAALLLATGLLLIIGRQDERHALPALPQLAWQILIISILLCGGWLITEITNPIQPGVFNLTNIALFNLPILAGLLTMLWLLLLMNAINWLDGTDGLAAGVGTIAFVTLAAISLLPATQDQQTLSAALAGLGGILGFLLWNFPPARVYLGATGSWYLGLYIGLVAIIGGGKIATTLLVLAMPVVDSAFVFTQRLLARRPPWRGDRIRHLHFRLRRAGLSDRAIAILGTGTSLAFASIAIAGQTTHKLFGFTLAALILITISTQLVWRQARKKQS